MNGIEAPEGKSMGNKRESPLVWMLSCFWSIVKFCCRAVSMSVSKKIRKARKLLLEGFALDLNSQKKGSLLILDYC